MDSELPALRAKAATEAGFIEMALQNPAIAAILAKLDALHVPDCWLVAGCLYQTVWNLMSDRSATQGIKDYDIFYFDGDDLSWEAEDQVIRRANVLFGDLDAVIEVRNQARVHLWYETHFGGACPPLESSRGSIARFPVRGTCIGLSMQRGVPSLAAPYGLGDAAAGILRPNPRLARADLFASKAASYRERWPWLQVRA